jgi:alcohol dehydrogenase class IV
MTPFAFLHSTRRVACAPGALDQLADLAKGRVAPAVILDPFFDTPAMRERLGRLLGDAVQFHAVPSHEPDTEVVEAARAFLAAAPFDMLVAIGGGSAMDAAKVARMLVSNPGDIRAIAGPVGVVMAPHPSLFVCVPTTAGTGSEVSESAVISAAGETYKLIFRSPEMTAAVALLDPELSVSAPRSVTAASGYDAVTHAVEAYTAKTANPMTDPIAFAAIETLWHALPRACEAPEDLDARAACLVASAQAAMAFNSANLGLAHAISGALGALHHVGHGLGNALALPWTMAFNQPALGAKGERLAALFGEPTAAAGLARLRERLGLDVSLDAVLPPGADLDAIAAAAARSGQLRVNPRTPTTGEIRAILEAMRRPTAGADPHAVA